METRANHVLIGLFTLLGLLAGLLFFVWLAKVQVDRQYAYYDILFDNVSGLSRASDVRFNGLPVGQVVDMRIAPLDPSRVQVRIEIDAETPIRTDSRAQLQAQGVTGVSFVAISGGSQDAPLLRDLSRDPTPEIPSERSVVQALTEDAPDALAEAIVLLKSLSELVGEQNRAYVSNILSNLDAASGQLDTALSDFTQISQTVSRATDQITVFTDRLDDIAASVNRTLDTANETMNSARGAISQAEETLATASGALAQAETTFASADSVLSTQAPQVVEDIGAVIRSVEAAVASIRAEAEATLSRFGQTADIAGARLGQLEATIATADLVLADARTTLAAIGTASSGVEELVTGEGSALVAEARATVSAANAAIARIDGMLSQDVPPVLADIRSAVTQANTVMTQVGEDVTAFTGRLDPLAARAGSTLEIAAQTLADASRTLGNLDRTLAGAETAIATAQGTFASANAIIEEQAAPTAADIRSAARQFEETVAAVAADLPAVTQELRATLEQASGIVARVDEVIAQASPRFVEFADAGLPQFVRFTREARSLVAILERLSERLERDPARFFFGTDSTNFRR